MRSTLGGFFWVIHGVKQSAPKRPEGADQWSGEQQAWVIWFVIDLCGSDVDCVWVICHWGLALWCQLSQSSVFDQKNGAMDTGRGSSPILPRGQLPKPPWSCHEGPSVGSARSRWAGLTPRNRMFVKQRVGGGWSGRRSGWNFEICYLGKQCRDISKHIPINICSVCVMAMWSYSAFNYIYRLHKFIKTRISGGGNHMPKLPYLFNPNPHPTAPGKKSHLDV